MSPPSAAGTNSPLIKSRVSIASNQNSQDKVFNSPFPYRLARRLSLFSHTPMGPAGLNSFFIDPCDRGLGRGQRARGTIELKQAREVRHGQLDFAAVKLAQGGCDGLAQGC